MRDLREYRRRRDPDRSPEPAGEEALPRPLPPGAPRRFVVQQHAARRMHWDLRLEIGGVLVSWAVPRGPTLDPAERRLAVQTEDHPLEYADFEGVIPTGNYGAGAMIVWDRGVFRTVDGSPPEPGLAGGKLDLVLDGHKLRGRFALVRTGKGASRDWLLLHKARRAAQEPELVEALPESVLSGLTVEELGRGVRRDEEVARAAREAGAPQAAVDPGALRPMLARTADAAFRREGWLFELKYDGVRVLAARRGEDVRIRARRGGDRTALYPELARALAHLPLDSFVIDGEVVALDEAGRSSFERLQRRFTLSDLEAVPRAEREVPVQLRVFDCLEAAGFDLRGCALRARKAILARFVPRRGFVAFADHVEGDGLALYEAAEAHGLEGIVAKRADAPYETGRRSERWLKIKVPRTARLVVVGVQPGKGSRRALGSLLLAGWRDGRLVYVGSAGSGLGEASVEALLPQLEARRRDAPAAEGLPERLPRGTFFVAPELVCSARYTEVTQAGLLRHPVFLGLAEGADPRDCEAPPLPGGTPARDAAAEKAAAAAAEAAAPRPPELALSRLEKVFWPVEGYTKGDLLAYYEAVWPWIAPYLRDRPVVLTRYPDGIEGKHFFQQNAPDWTPEWATHQTLDGTDYFVCNDLRTLLYVVNSGAIPLHVWSARLPTIDHPDWLVLDLDPKGAPMASVVHVARHLHALLDDLGAPHHVKTSGQEGLHVLVPLGARLDHEHAKGLAEVLARTVVAELPDVATVTRPVAARGGRVYVDFLQNGRGKLIAAPLSVRPRPHAPVSTPLTWPQVTRRLDPTRFTLRTVPGLLAQRGDPMRPVLEEAADVEALLGALGERLAAAAGEGMR